VCQGYQLISKFALKDLFGKKKYVIRRRCPERIAFGSDTFTVHRFVGPHRHVLVSNVDTAISLAS
jgi:hypothetical protein